MRTLISVRITTFALCLSASALAFGQSLQIIDPRFADGLAEYRRARPSMLQITYFGGIVRWTPHWVPCSERDALQTRAGLAFLTLSRWLGRPALDSALDSAANAGPLTAAAFADVVSTAAGERLDWFWRVAFDPRTPIDYGVWRVERDKGGARVTVARYGVPFTGTSREPIGPYEAGNAIVVRTSFADGEQITESWDGRRTTKTFSYVSASPVVRVEVDPDYVLALETNRTNNTWTAAPRRGAAARRWAARWAVWLQNALASYAFFV